jgi:putative FmdB family regulatory protein
MGGRFDQDQRKPMPLYEYVCDTCGYSFERLQSFHDAPVAQCPSCGSPVRRVISPVGVIFKGSGWYITDSKRQIGATERPSLSDRKKGDGAGKGDTSAKSDAAAKNDAATGTAAKAPAKP